MCIHVYPVIFTGGGQHASYIRIFFYKIVDIVLSLMPLAINENNKNATKRNFISLGSTKTELWHNTAVNLVWGFFNSALKMRRVSE